MKRVLHVDDEARLWLPTVKNALEALGGYEVFSFESLENAQQAAADQQFDYYVCDRNIAGDDGGLWAKELYDQGKKVAILASEGYENVPFLSKGGFKVSALIELLESL